MQPVLIGIGVYLVVQFALGMLVSRRIASESDYLNAGRRLGVTLAAFSIFATWFGAETVVGAAGRIYQNGLSGGSADPFGYALCLVVLGVVVAVPLWLKQYTTFGDMFRERYSQGVERLAVLLMVPTSVLWAAAQIRAFGQVVSVSSDIGVDIAITAAAAFVIIYTVAGGLLADVVTDFVQSIGIVVGLAILLLAVGNAHGGLLANRASIDPGRLGLFSTADATPLELLEAWAVPVCGSLLAVEMLSRILGCKTAVTRATRRWSARRSISWSHPVRSAPRTESVPGRGA
jgi:Na+/proline symporter